MSETEWAGQEITPQIAALEQAIAFAATPHDYIHLAALLQEQQRIEEGLARLASGLDRFPDSLPLLHWLCQLNRQSGRHLACIGWARQGLAVYPGNVHFIWLLAESQMQAGLLDEALITLNEGLARHPGTIALLDLMVQRCHRTGDIAAAVAAARELVTIDPGNVHQWLRLSHLQFEARAFGDADATLVAAERDHPGHEALRHHRSHFQTLRPVFEAWEPWPASDDPNSDWHAEHQQLCRNLRSVRPRLLFIGDSITAELEEKAQSVWERHFLPLRAAQIGIPADRTQNVLWRLENGAARGVSPEVVVLLIGTNNLLHNDDAGVVRGISAVIDRLRASLPQSRLLVLGILPREVAPDAPLRGRIATINQNLGSCCAGRGVQFADIGAMLLDPQGRLVETVSPDGLHLSVEGYHRLAASVLALLAERFGIADEASEPVRLAIAGNSNSILHASYVNHLARMPGFEVSQFSIGGCPNALLLHVLTRADPRRFDWIICDTSVIDAGLSGSGLYSREEAELFARRFVASVQEAGRSRLIFLILPIHTDNLSPDAVWVRELYATMARESGGYVFDLYGLLEKLSGRLSDRLSRSWADETFSEAMIGFGLPPTLTRMMLYHPEVLKAIGVPPLVQQFYADPQHISGFAQGVVARVLAECLNGRCAPVPSEADAACHPATLAIAPKTQAEMRPRRSSLLTRDMAVLGAGDQVIYHAPPGHCLAALLINASATNGVMEISGPKGVFALDLRTSSLDPDRPYTAVVLPLTEDIGDGPFTLRMRSGEGALQAGRRFSSVATERMEAVAEVAELVVVRRDLPLRSLADAPRDDEPDLALHPWFETTLRAAQNDLQWVANSHMQDQATIPRYLFDRAEEAAERDADRPRAFTLARMAFIAGDFPRTARLLDKARAQSPDDAAILAQINAFERLRARLLC